MESTPSTSNAFSGSVLDLPSLSSRKEKSPPVPEPPTRKRVDAAQFKERRRFDVGIAHIRGYLERVSPSPQGKNTQKNQLGQLAQELGTLPHTGPEVVVTISPPLSEATVPDLDSFCLRDTGLPPVFDVFQESWAHHPDAKRHGPCEIASEEFGKTGVAANYIPPWAARAVEYSLWSDVRTTIHDAGRVKSVVSQLVRESRRGSFEDGIFPYVRRAGSIRPIETASHVLVPHDELIDMDNTGCIAPALFTTASSQRPSAVNTELRACYSPDVPGLQTAWELYRFLVSKQNFQMSTASRTHIGGLRTTIEDYPDPFTTALACRASLFWTSTAVNCVHDGLGPFDTQQAYLSPCSITSAAAYIARVGIAAPAVYGPRISDMFSSNIGAASSTPHPTKSTVPMRTHIVSTGFFALSPESTVLAAARAAGTGIKASMVCHTPPIMGQMGGKPAALLSRPWICCGKLISAVHVVGCYLPPISPSAIGVSRPLKLATQYSETPEVEGERTTLQQAGFDLVAPIIRGLYEKATNEVDAEDNGMSPDDRVAAVQDKTNTLVSKSMHRLVRMGPVAKAVVTLTSVRELDCGKTRFDPNVVFTTDACVFFMRARQACETSQEDAYLFFKTEQVIRTAFYAQVLCASPKYLHDWAVLYALNYERPRSFHPGKERGDPAEVSLDLFQTVNLITLAFGNMGRPERPFSRFVEQCMHSLATVIISKMTGTFVVPQILNANNA